MDGHLTFEEMADAAFLEVLDEESKVLLFRVQSHIIKCKECKETYGKLVSLHDAAGRLAQDTVTEFSHKAAALRFLHTLSGSAALGRDRVLGLMDKLVSTTNELYITAKTQFGKITELAAHRNDAFEFGYAVPIGARGSAKSGSDRTVLVDDHDADNRIFVDNNNCLTIQIRAENYTTPDPHIIIVSDTGEVNMSEPSLSGEVYTAQFDGLGEGGFHIFLE